MEEREGGGGRERREGEVDATQYNKYILGINSVQNQWCRYLAVTRTVVHVHGFSDDQK